MATIRIKFRPSTIEGKEGSLFYQVIHKRIARQISTGYKLLPEEWDYWKAESILSSQDNHRMKHLLSIKEKTEKDMRKMKEVIAILEEQKRPYTAEEIVKAYMTPEKTVTFFIFMRTVIKNLEDTGRIRLAETYTTTLNSFTRFRNKKDVSIDEIDSDLIVAYENYLKNRDVCPNSSSFYMRCLRAVYNRAVNKGLTVQRYPFKLVFTGIDKTVKRAVSLNEIRQIRKLDLQQEPTKEFARDLFLLSFYLRGCAFVDLAYLKKKDLRHGILSYRRQKTGQKLSIRWEKCMQEILDKYDTTGSPYLLPIIKNHEINERKQYLNAAHLVNNKLKEIGKRLKIASPLTIYRARHAWASIARSKNIPISVISQGMGHTSESTTQIYLASLDTATIDKANSLILKSI